MAAEGAARHAGVVEQAGGVSGGGG